MTRSWALGATCMVWAVLLLGLGLWQWSPPPSATPLPAPKAAGGGAIRLDAADLLPRAESHAMGDMLLAHDDFARDVSFLVAASLRERCMPAHAHDMARMAVIARLPALEGVQDAFAAHPEWRPGLYAMIRAWAAAAPCRRTLHLVIGHYETDLVPEQYAAMFPDSFFDPSLAEAPPDIAGRTLASRTADPCAPLIYTVLPLDTQQAWTCLGLRASWRRRLGDQCRASVQGDDKIDARTSKALAATIHGQLLTLPAMCR